MCEKRTQQFSDGFRYVGGYVGETAVPAVDDGIGTGTSRWT